MSKAVFEALLSEAYALYQAAPELQAFAPWPEHLEFREKAPVMIPATRQIAQWKRDNAFHKATQAMLPFGDWKQTYTENEVGYGFLQDYGYIELFGPDGHFHCQELRGYVGYWGRGLYYPWHRHEAEEIYCVVSGGGLFEAEGAAPRKLGPRECQFHASNQPHALTMSEGPILTFVLWRGSGMDGLPLMGAA